MSCRPGSDAREVPTDTEATSMMEKRGRIREAAAGGVPRWLLALAVLVVAGLVAGGGYALATLRPQPRPANPVLQNSYASAEHVARAALDALERGDREALEAMLVTTDEYRTHFWEQLPNRGLPFKFVRVNSVENTRRALNELLPRWEGERFELLDVRYNKDVEHYADFTLYRGAILRVRRISDGRIGELELLDVLFDRGGEWKPLNYRAE